MTGPGKELESTERLWVAGGAGGLRLSVTSRSAVEILQSRRGALFRIAPERRRPIVRWKHIRKGHINTAYFDLSFVCIQVMISCVPKPYYTGKSSQNSNFSEKSNFTVISATTGSSRVRVTTCRGCLGGARGAETPSEVSRPPNQRRRGCSIRVTVGQRETNCWVPIDSGNGHSAASSHSVERSAKAR